MARVFGTRSESADRLTCYCQDVLADFILEDNHDFCQALNRFKSTRDIACPNLARLFAHRSMNRYTLYRAIGEYVVYILINYQGFLIF